MHSSRFAKLSVMVLIAAIFTLATVNSLNVKAGPLAAGTSAATVALETCIGATQSAATAKAVGTMVATAKPAVGEGNIWIGFQVSAVDDCGLRIITIDPSTAAGKSPLKVGDLIIAVDCMPVSTLKVSAGGPAATMQAMTSCPQATGTPAALATLQSQMYTPAEVFMMYVQLHKAGDTILITIQRGGKPMDVPIVLGTHPNASGAGGGRGSAPEATLPATKPAK